MSRIGKLPIPVPSGVDVFIEPELVKFEEKLADITAGHNGYHLVDDDLLP